MEGPLTALRGALSALPEGMSGLIHHSDRGIQYCCKEYVSLLKTNNIRISMTENGDPYENALAERVNGILKDEWLNLERFRSFEQAEERIGQVIRIYNELRPHLSCGMKTPQQMHDLARGTTRGRSSDGGSQFSYSKNNSNSNYFLSFVNP